MSKTPFDRVVELAARGRDNPTSLEPEDVREACRVLHTILLTDESKGFREVARIALGEVPPRP